MAIIYFIEHGELNIEHSFSTYSKKNIFPVVTYQ